MLYTHRVRIHKQPTVVGLCVDTTCDDSRRGEVLSTVDDDQHLLITLSVQLCGLSKFLKVQSLGKCPRGKYTYFLAIPEFPDNTVRHRPISRKVYVLRAGSVQFSRFDTVPAIDRHTDGHAQVGHSYNTALAQRRVDG